MDKQSLRRFGWSYAVAAYCVLACSGCNMMATGQNANGVRHFNQGQYQAAVHEFQQALLNDQKNEDALYNMARTYHQIGRQTNDPKSLETAERLYNECIDVNENHVDCRRALTVLLAETNRREKAFNHLKIWASSNPALADPQIELARLHQEHGDLRQAKQHLETALTINYNNPRVLAALGQIREMEGDKVQALANYQRAYAMNPMQGQLGERVASLQRELMSTSTTPGMVTPGAGTRTVAVPMPNTRY